MFSLAEYHPEHFKESLVWFGLIEEIIEWMSDFLYSS
jgi:hypothetical protein